MSDISTYIPAAPAFGQIAQGGANAHDNCIPDAFAYLAKCYGLTYVPPENWVLDEYGVPAPGATSVPNAVKEAAHIYGAGFPSSISSGPDLNAVDAALNQGRPSIILSHVNCATVRYGAGTCGHAGIVIGHSGGLWKIWNPWYGSIDSVSDGVLASNIYYQTIFQTVIGGSDMDAALAARLSTFLDRWAAEAPGSDFRYWLAYGGQTDPAHPENSHNMKMEAQLLPRVDPATGKQVQNLAFQITDTENHLRNVIEPLIPAIKSEVDALAAHSDPAVAAAVANVQATLNKIETALRGA